MNATKMLMAEFHRFAEVPDAVPRLRRFVLDLAVRGKLVEWDGGKGDGAAGMRINHDFRDAFLVEPPWPPPRGWMWTPLATFMAEARGTVDASVSPNTTYCLWSVPSFASGKPEIVKGSQLGSAKRAIARGSVLLSKINPHLNRVWITDGYSEYPHIASSEWITLTSQGVERELLRYFLMSPWFLGSFCAERSGIGGSLTRVRPAAAARLLLPMPPLAEQRRIVAKVDELMALCDRLEAAQKERESGRKRLVAAFTARLSGSEGIPVRREAGRSYLGCLNDLSRSVEQLEQTRQTIRDLAVRGYLTPTDVWPSHSEPLGEYAQLQGGYAFESSWFSRQGMRLVRNANVGHGRLRWDETEYLPVERTGEFERFRLDEGDVVLSMDRPFIATGTKVARICAEDLPCLLLQRVGRFQPRSERLTSDYLFLWLRSAHFTAQVDPGRSNGVPHISSRQVEAAEIFVPSAPEQRRIVAKVDELMGICDRLEEQIRIGQTEGVRLLEAVLHEALAEAS